MVFTSSKCLQLLLLCTAVWLHADAEETVTGDAEEPRPYLLVATHNKIMRMDLNGSNVKTLVNDSGIVAVDYHYRLNLVFWMTSYPAYIKYASLSDGSNRTELCSRKIQDSAGLVVDWINDKVYWADKYYNAIYVYDLITKETDKVRDIPESNPTKIKIYPQLQHSSWLYMGDLRRDGIYRIPVDGGGEEKLVQTLCPDSLTLDYRHGDLYWLDGCNYQIGTSKIDGSESQLLETTGNQMFPYGTSVIDSHIYWSTKHANTASVYCFERNEAVKTEIYSEKGTVIRDVQVVHRANQLSLLELGELDECLAGCVHGNCISTPGECICDEGWTGPGCSTDVDECADGNGGCQQRCVNQPGAFKCECDNGMELEPDQKTCTASNSASSVPHTTQPSPPTTPPTTSAPPTTLPTTSAPPTTPPTTSAPPSTSTSTTSTTLPSTTSAPPTAPPTTSPTSPPSTTPPAQPSPAIPTSLTTDQENLGSQETTISPPLGEGNLVTEEGLQANSQSTTPIIVVIVLSTVILITLVAISMYVCFLFYKRKQHRKGSYNVQLRQQEQRPRQDSNAEFGTSSAHSSFRDITERYQREIAMSVGSAELGMARGLAGQSACLSSLESNEGRSLRCVSEASSSCGLILETVHDSELRHGTGHSA